MKTKRFNNLKINTAELRDEIKHLTPELNGHFFVLMINTWELCLTQYSFQDTTENWKNLLILHKNNFLEIRKKLLNVKHSPVKSVKKPEYHTNLCEIPVLKRATRKLKNKSKIYQANSKKRKNRKIV